MRTLLAVARRTPRPYRVPLGMAALLAFALTCKDVTVTPVAVRNVAVAPSDTTLTVGEELTLAAVVTDEAGNRLMDRAVTWSSENNDVVSVSPTGEVVAVSSGETNVTAAVDGRSGAATIHVMDDEDERVETVQVEPAETNIAVGKTVELEATARSASGAVLEGRDVSWSSSDDSIASIDNNGVVTGEAPGEVTITATVDSVDGSASVTVAEEVEPVATVEVEPAETSITVGATVELEAIARSDDDTVLGGRDVSWSSSDDSVASVDDNGVVTGEASGEATITAAIDSVDGSASVTVTEEVEPVATVEVEPADTSITVGATVDLDAIARSDSEQVLAEREVSWSSNNPDVAAVNEDGLVTGATAGQATITATIEGVDGAAQVAVTEAIEPVDRVVVVPADTSLLIDETVNLTAIALSAAGDTLEGREVEWSSSNTDIATVDESQGIVTGVAAGTATIQAEIEGVEATAEVTVLPEPVASVEIAPADTTLAEGDSATLHAIVTDENGNDLTDREVTWLSSSSSIAPVRETDTSQLDAIVTAGSCPTGQVSCDAEISATADSITGTAMITVEKVPATVAITPEGPVELYPDSVIPLTALVRASDGTDLTSAKPVTWSSSDEAVAIVDPSTGQVTAVGTPCGPPETFCSVTITATVDDASAQVEIHVLKPVDSVAINPADTTLLLSGAAPFVATLSAADGTPLPGRSTSWNWAGASTSASPCGADSGQVQISLDPTEGVSDAIGEVSTTATVEPATLAGFVRIWAEAEGATGCAILRVVLVL